MPNRVAELRDLLRASAGEDRSTETWLVMLQAEVATAAACCAGRHLAESPDDRAYAAEGARQALGTALALAAEALDTFEMETGLTGSILPLPEVSRR